MLINFKKKDKPQETVACKQITTIGYLNKRFT